MKGVVNIEFILSVVVFLSTISFVSMIIISNMPFLHQESFTENLKSKVYQISYLLLFDEGLSKTGGKDWNKDNVARIGLSAGEPYVLSNNKINNLNNLCNENYDRVRELIAGYTYVSLNISYLNGNQILDCRPKEKIGLEFLIKRFAVINGDIVRFDISIVGI